ncbi:hypothetical protein Tco_0130458, partial [Tanacetum coccineum]
LLGDDAYDEEEASKEDEEEEEEHLALADSSAATSPVMDPVPSAEDTEPFETNKSAATPPSGTPPILPILLPTSSLPLPLPSTDHRAYDPEVVLPPRKRLCIALGPRFKVRKGSSAAAARPTGGFRAYYGFVGTLDAEIRRDPDREVGYGITGVWDTYEIYGKLDDAQKARVARQAWAQSMDASHRARSEVMTLRTMVSTLHTKNEELRVADHRRQTQLLETLTQ